MTEEQQKQQRIMEFQKGREQLLSLGSRKQQLQMQLAIVDSALVELKDSKQEKVYKLVGNIMIEKSTKDAEKELKELKEQLESKIDTMQKQEDSLINRLNKLKSQIESKEKEE
ncbi:MAG: prefoldin subunit [Candidatus Diapherotrites archaeon]|nr:prefoldin subunit [Candidatus Diapherotrites archaeon]